MNFRTLDLNLLRVFDVVMVERNVTRAAARLAMTQPAVSNALRRLREATREELFIPGPAGVTPTPRAQTMWPAVREALESLRDLFEPRDFNPRVAQRGFTLAMADATAAVLMPGLLEAIGRERAQVDLRVVPLATRDPRPMLEQGLADAAVGFFPDLSRSVESTDAAVLEPLYDCRYVCVMRHDHPLAEHGALTLDSYCEASHLRVSFAGRPRGFVDEALARVGRKRRVALTVNEFATAGCVVQQSDLITVLPRSFARAVGMAGGLARRPVPLELPRIDVSLLWHRRHEYDGAQRWLRDTLGRAARSVAAAAA
jgi:DNA-binding transcriptional LysR family regulator